MAIAGSVAAGSEWRRFWTLPLAAAFGYSMSIIHIYSFGAFIEPLQQQFGWSRAQASMGLTIAGVGSALFSLPMGMLVDRWGPRRIGLLGAPLMAGCFALLATATGTLTNWLTLWSIAAVGVLWVQTSIWTSAVASRFESSRGSAFAVTLSGASVGGAVLPVLATSLIGSHGWRTAFVATSGIWIALVLPMLWLWFRGAYDSADATRVGAASASAPSDLEGLSLADGLRAPAFYKLLLAGGVFAFTVVGVIVHFVPILTDSGMDRLAASGIAALIGIFSIVGRLGTGMLLDRFSGRLIGALASLLPVLGCSLLIWAGEHPLGQALTAITVGLTLGAEIDVIAYLATRHFGLKSFGALFGGLYAALALGTALGPLAAGMVFDRYGTYVPFLTLTIALMLLSSAMFASLSRPEFEQRH